MVQGQRQFAAVMFSRLKKLGIDKTNPEDLTAEERGRWGDVAGGGRAWRVGAHQFFHECMACVTKLNCDYNLFDLKL